MSVQGCLICGAVEHDDTSLSCCWAHQRVEAVPADVYRVCYECGHVYRRALSLRLAYLRESWKIAKHPIQPPSFAPHVAAPPAPWWRRYATLLLRVAHLDADDIHFCQECVHDF